MSHYPSYYARQPGPPAQAPIASSMYSARPLAAQSAYSAPVGHNNAHPHDHKHPQPPPKHPAQRQRSNSAQGQTQPHVAQPASSQAQMQSYQRPSAGGGQAGQQYGQVQQPYNPSYAQTRPGGAPAPIQRGPVPYTGHQPYQTQSRAPIPTQAPPQASAYANPAPGQAQRTYSYPPPGQPVQQQPGPYPPSTQSAYARGLSAFQQQQQRQQQQQQQQQHHYQPPGPAPQQYTRPAAPPAQIPPPANPSPGGRRPLPTPGPSGTSPARARPISMPPQRSQTYQQPPSTTPYSHSSSSSLSHIIPTSSFASTSAAPAASPFPPMPRDTSPTRRPLPPPSPGPRAPEVSTSTPASSAPIGIPRSTNMQFQGHHGPSKSMPVNAYGNTQAASSHALSTSPQRRALPSSPNDAPTLSQLASGNLARRGTVSAMVSKFAGTNGPPSPTKSTAQAPPPTSPYTPRAPVRSTTLPGTTAAPPAAYQTHEDMYEDDDDPDASFSDEETASSAFDAAETESRASSQTTMSPQYGIRDLPRRSAFASGSASAEPQSPQYGILDLPRRAKSVYDRTRSWEQQSGQADVSSSWTSTAVGSATTRRGSMDIGIARNAAPPAASPTKLMADPLSMPPPKHPHSTSLAKPVTPISPSKSPQPQQPQQEQKLPMPPVRHPKPSRTERTPSWTLPTANLDRIQVQAPAQLPPVAETSGTSMAFKFATMSLNDESGSARQAQTQRYQSTSSTTNSRQTSPTRPSAYEAAMQFKQAQKQKEKEEEERQQQARMQAQPRPQPPSHPSSRAPSPSKAYPPFAMKTPRVAHANLDLSLDDAPPPSLRRSPSPSPSTTSSSVPSIPTIRTPDDGPGYGAVPNQYVGGRSVPIPVINLPGDADYDDPPDNQSAYTDVSPGHAPNIVISPQPFSPQKVPVINLPDDDFDDIPKSGPIISVSAPPASAPGTPAMPVILSDLANSPNSSPTKSPRTLPRPPPGNQTPPSSAVSSSSSGSSVRPRGGGLVCGGCHKSIIGRIVSAMGLRWHPQCFKCCTCGELLEHVSSYEHDGKPYCHLDYHEVRISPCLSPFWYLDTYSSQPIGIRSAVLYLQDAHHRRAVHHTR